MHISLVLQSLTVYIQKKNTTEKPNQAILCGLYSSHTPVHLVYEMLQDRHFF